MREVDPGHLYALTVYDVEPTKMGNSNVVSETYLGFMKREGPEYPGNVGHGPGTNCQEVLRALIARVKYVDNQIPHKANTKIIAGLRQALLGFEVRAAERRGATFPPSRIDIEDITMRIEEIKPCPKCGHLCGDSCK